MAPGTDITGGQPRFAGRQVTLGGVVYTVAPLAVGRLKTLLPVIARCSAVVGVPTPDQWDDFLEIFLAAFQRNNPDMTKAMLEDLVDLGNFKPLMEMVMGVSGLEKAAGEALPGAEHP